MDDGRTVVADDRLDAPAFHPECKRFPLMRDTDPAAFARLVEDIKRNNLREPGVVTDGLIIDGRNRYWACKKAGVEFRTVEWDGKGTILEFVISKNLHRRHLTQSQQALIVARCPREGLKEEARKRQIEGARRGGKEAGRGRAKPQCTNARSQSDKRAVAQHAQRFGVSPRYVYDALAIDRDAPALAKEIEQGRKTITEVKRELKAKRQESERRENTRKVRSAKKPEDIEGAYSTIVIDPPWDFSEEFDNNVHGRTRPTYAQMSETEIAALPISKLAAKDCHLYLWITNRSLMTGKGWRLCEAWGFRPITILTWCKPSIGTGNYFRNNTEQLVFAVKGSLPLRVRNAPTWFQLDRGPHGHSSKPIEFPSMVASWSPGPYLEMFARSDRDGWVTWGADVDECATPEGTATGKEN